MPAFGYLLLINEHLHRLLPSLWRVWLLFYGSFSLALGAILFAFLCPIQIKRYESEYSYVDTERPHLTAHGLTPQIADELRLLYRRMSKWEASIFGMPRLEPDLPNLGAGTRDDLRTGDQWGLGLIHIWRLNDIKYPRLRITILLLFWAGLILLAIPAGITFLQVTHLLWRQLAAHIW